MGHRGPHRALPGPSPGGRIDRTWRASRVFNSDYEAANARLAQIVDRRIGPGSSASLRCTPTGTPDGSVALSVGPSSPTASVGSRCMASTRFPAAICEVARSYRLPILVDVVRQTAAVEMLASQYPDVNFIIPHLGGFADDWMTYMQVIDQMSRYQRVRRHEWRPPTSTRGRAVRRAGPHKLLFGSDGPQLHPSVELHKVTMLGLPPAAEARVTGGNVLRLLAPERP